MAVAALDADIVNSGVISLHHHHDWVRMINR